MPRGGTHALGLDIGSSAIKAVELQLTSAGIELVGTPACIPTPPGSVTGGVIVDGASISAALTDMISAYGFGTRQVIASVGGDTSVAVRVASMPRMERKELDDAMQWELDRQTPFPVDQVIFDYQVINPSTEAEGDTMDVFLAVAQEDMVDALVDALGGAKLTPVHIDVEPLAITRALVDVAENGYQDQAVMVVHIGATTTEICVESRGWVTFVRTLPVAGNTLTDAVREHITGDEAQAEQAKRQFANLAEETEPAEEDGDIARVRQAVQEAISQPIFDLADEVRRTVEYYQRQHREEPIQIVLLSGGSAVIPGLAEFLQGETGMTTQVANPYQHLVCDEQEVAADYLSDVGPATTVAAGLAMRDMFQD